MPTEADRILRAERPPLDPEWVEAVFERVERLVERRDEAFLAQTLAELAREAFGRVRARGRGGCRART